MEPLPRPPLRDIVNVRRIELNGEASGQQTRFLAVSIFIDYDAIEPWFEAALMEQPNRAGQALQTPPVNQTQAPICLQPRPAHGFDLNLSLPLPRTVPGVYATLNTAASSPQEQSQNTITPQSSAPDIEMSAAEIPNMNSKPSSQDSSSSHDSLASSSDPDSQVHGRPLSELTFNQILTEEERVKEIDEANTNALIRILALQERLVPLTKRVNEIEASKLGIQQGDNKDNGKDDVKDDSEAVGEGEDEAAVKPAVEKTTTKKYLPVDRSVPKGTRQSARMNRRNRQSEEAAKVKQEADEKEARIEKAKNAREEYRKKRNVTIMVTPAEHAEYLRLSAETYQITAEVAELEKQIASTKTSKSAAWVRNIADRVEVAEALRADGYDSESFNNRNTKDSGKGTEQLAGRKRAKSGRIYGLAKEGGKAVKYVNDDGAEDSMNAEYEEPRPAEYKPYGSY